MRKFLLILFAILILEGCISGWEDYGSKRLTKDFWLNWFPNKEGQHIALSEDGKLETVIIESTVFAVGYNDDFIIAKQTRGNRQFGERNTYYHILDLRKYESMAVGIYKHYSFKSKAEFQVARKKMMVPADLGFSIHDRDLE